MRIPTPEDVLRDSDAEDLVLSLRCTGCGATSKERFAWACVHPRATECRAEGWDGVFLSRIFSCAKCGLVDTYELIRDSYLLLTAGALDLALRGTPSRIIIAEMKLWDGTQVRRPSQALARLRELAVQQPNSAEAHRRLGNGCERFGLLEEGVAAWRRAVTLDENDLDSLNSLAAQLLRAEATGDEGFGFVMRAVHSIPLTQSMEGESRRAAIFATFELLREFAEDDQPMALMAGWKGHRVGKDQAVHMSSVDLRDVLEVWDRLVEFAASPEVLSLGLTGETPEEANTQLKELLFEGGASSGHALLRPVIAEPKVGRNEPCPCGSGIKFKRCCAT